MCIYTNNDECKVAEHDIPCIKIVRRYVDNDGETVYVSLYHFVEPVKYVVGGIIKMNDWMDKRHYTGNIPDHISVLNKMMSHQYHPDRFKNLRNCVDEGIHSFKPDAKALESMKDWAVVECADYYKEHPEADNVRLPKNDLGIALLNCVIPAGTKYVEGVHNCLCRSNIYEEDGYCSECIKVIEELKIY